MDSKSSKAPPPVVVPEDSRGAGSGEIPSQGDLAHRSPLHLYYLAASGDATGLLSLRLVDRTIDIHFRKGNPESVASNHAEDSLDAFLLKEGLVSPAQLETARAGAQPFGGELISALFGLGILNPAGAFAHLARRASGLLVKALSADRGSFSFQAKPLPPHRAMPLGHRWAVLADAVRRIPLRDIQQRLSAAMDRPVIKSGGRVPASELRLTPQETRAFASLDGVRSLQQLRKDTPADGETFLRLVFLLRELELVSLGPAPPAAPAPAPPSSGGQRPSPPRPSDTSAARPASTQRPASAKPAPAAPPPSISPAAPAPPAASPARAAPSSSPPAAPAPPRATAAAAPTAPRPSEDLPALRTLASELKSKNHFELLGLNERADAAAIKAAYFKLAKVYHPDTIPPGASPELGELKESIFSAIGQAYRALADDKLRAKYLEELKAGGGEQVDVAQILLAEEHFQKGMVLVKGRRFADALKVLDLAIAGNPDEPEFYAWRGFAKFFTFTDKEKGRAEAMKDITHCIKHNERVAAGHYFAGQVAKLSGDTAGATRAFKRAVELQPNYIEAQRELRALGLKK